MRPPRLARLARLRALQRHLSGRGGALAAPVTTAAPAAAAVPGAPADASAAAAVLSAEQIEQYVASQIAALPMLLPLPPPGGSCISAWACVIGALRNRSCR